MMTALTIARVSLVRLLRDRMGLFFVFLLPVVLIVVLGTVYGGRTAPRLGIVSVDPGSLGGELVAALASGDLRLEIRELRTDGELLDAVEAGTVELGMRIPDGYDTTLREGGSATIALYGRPESAVSALREGVASAVAAQAARVTAARLAELRGVAPFDAALLTAAAVQERLPGISVTTIPVGRGIFPEGTTEFQPGAQSQLVLFMFLTSMTAATQLILSRQLGVSRRMVSTPTPIRTIVVGEVLGRFGVAMVQGLFIVLLSAFVFGVAWGEPVAAGLIVIEFALIGTGAAMVVAVFSNDPDQASAMGVLLGMALGALGGAMVPLEVFGQPMRTIAMLTPHAWAIEGLRAVALRGAAVGDVVIELLALGLFATALIALGVWRFRRLLAG
jgi:ABC-2 type transport system permease protein